MPRLQVVCMLVLLAATSSAQIWREFLRLPDANIAREHLQVLTSEPHLAGTKGDQFTIDYVYGQFRSYGLEVLNSSYDVYLPFPVSARLRALPPHSFEAVLKETAYPEVGLN